MLEFKVYLEKINRETFQINLNKFIDINIKNNDLKEIINSIKNQFDIEFPIYKDDKIKDYNPIIGKNKLTEDDVILVFIQLDKNINEKNLENKKNFENKNNVEKKGNSLINKIANFLTDGYSEDDDEIIKLKKKIEILEKENKNLKLKLDSIVNGYNSLKYNLIEKDEIIQKLKNKLLNNIQSNESLLNCSIKNINIDNKIIELMESLQNKENEIKELKRNFPYDLKSNEKLMTIIFYSLDQKIHYAFICKNTDQFIKLETQLYEVYPEIKNYENYFLSKGNKNNKFNTMEENNIHNSDIIILSSID